MRRGMLGALVVVMIGVASPVYAAQPAQQDTIVDQVGDWFATLGKSGVDKDAILAQRRTERTAAHAQKAAKRQVKAAGQSVENAGRDLNKGINNALKTQ